MNYNALMDNKQKHVHEHFSKNDYLSDPEHVQKVMDWLTFWRRNVNRFVEYYLGIHLHLYQHIILHLMPLYPSVCIVACRSAAKSFLIAAYACAAAVLWPGSKIVIASATKKQARLIVSEKIKKEILPRSPLLNAEISGFKDSQNDVEVTFHNGSSIIVVPASDNARGYRATILIYEEFRMIAKHIIDSVLSPFLVSRQAPFINDDDYAFLQEESKEIYISSAWFKSHWMWDLIKDYGKQMLTHPIGDKQSALVLAFDYSVTLRHRIKTRTYLEKERRKLDSVAWAIEYENQMVSENEHAYFTYELLNKNRVMKNAFYPRRSGDIIHKNRTKTTIPKKNGEIRIISCDIAVSGGNINDNSVFSCIRLLPESKEHKSTDVNGEHIEVVNGYRRQVVYLEAHNGGETAWQAIRIKQLFADFDADYCVLDGRNAGESIYDALAKILYDEERHFEYVPWTCMNDEKLANKIVIPGQLPVVYVIKATAELNSKIAVTMRKTLEDGMMDLLVPHQEGIEQLQQSVPEYAAAEVEAQLFYEAPYLETGALVTEMVDLEYTVMNQTGMIRIEERSGKRKDRYTSVSYGNYFAYLLEQDLFSQKSDYEFLALAN